MKSLYQLKMIQKVNGQNFFFSLKYMISCVFKTKDWDEDEYFYHSADFSYLR